MRATIGFLPLFIFTSILTNVSDGMDINIMPDETDEILHLPGLPSPLPFRHFSGYLRASPTRLLHYWFVDAATAEPEKEPLLLWLNGGPGCSSLFGMLNENGPFLVNDNATLRFNPYAWNKVANVLYLESPAGVGYSMSTDGNITTSDDHTADLNYEALVHFYRKFPHLLGTGLHISGESYAGIYIPTLALRVIHNSNMALKGILVGNGVSHYELNDNSLLYFAHFHSLLGEKLWREMNAHCCSKHINSTQPYCLFTRGQSNHCLHAVHEALDIIDYGLNVYNMYAPCHGGVPQAVQDNDIRYPTSSSSSNSNSRPRLVRGDYLDATGMLFRKDVYVKLQRELRKRMFLAAVANQPAGESSSDPHCYNITAATAYLNKPEVRQAIHIPPHLPRWSLCNDRVTQSYQNNYQDLTEVYRKLILHPTGKCRILFYYGDFDMACNYLGQEWFLDSMKMPESETRRPWFYRQAEDSTLQIGGYTRSWFSGQVIFTTVRGSGHMVPQDKPEQAMHLLSRFIAQQPL